MKKFNFDKISEYKYFCFIDSDDEIFHLIHYIRPMTEDEKKDDEKTLLKIDDTYIKVYGWMGSLNNSIQNDDMEGYYNKMSAVCDIVDYASIRNSPTDVYMFETQSEMYKWMSEKLKKNNL